VARWNATHDTPLALPDGYAPEGDSLVYHEPAPIETEAQRLARERDAAMPALRASKARLLPEVAEGLLGALL
jgi:hypothetical protein